MREQLVCFVYTLIFGMIMVIFYFLILTWWCSRIFLLSLLFSLPLSCLLSSISPFLFSSSINFSLFSLSGYFSRSLSFSISLAFFFFLAPSLFLVLFLTLCFAPQHQQKSSIVQVVCCRHKPAGSRKQPIEASSCLGSPLLVLFYSPFSSALLCNFLFLALSF